MFNTIYWILNIQQMIKWMTKKWMNGASESCIVSLNTLQWHITHTAQVYQDPFSPTRGKRTGNKAMTNYLSSRYHWCRFYFKRTHNAPAHRKLIL